jgi:acetyl esterase/lipase
MSCTRAWLISSLAVVLLAAPALAQDRPVELLWKDGAPGAVGQEDADKPSLTIWRADSTKNTRTAVVVCPGGGYGGLANDHEGKQIAEFLNSYGISAFVLKYRLAPRYKHPSPMLDVQRAIRFVRTKAKEYEVEPDRVGVMGFSAGGHLASTAATHFNDGKGADMPVDAVDQASSRPDFAILCYPVITMDPTVTHGGSRKNLLGENPDPALVKLMSNDEQVSPRTPPTFLFHTTEDTAVVPENAILFYLALRKHKVPAELHIYERGRHGVGLAQSDPVVSSWSGRLVDWLGLRGLTKRPKVVAATPEEAQADPDFAVQGEYSGELPTADGPRKFGVQVIAEGYGKFSAVAYEGGLPGDGWDGSEKIRTMSQNVAGVLTFKSDKGSAVWKDGALHVSSEKGDALGQLKKIRRESQTLGMRPPEGAVVLFDGTTGEHFEGARLTQDALLMEGITSKRKFGDCTLHLEFRLPYQPDDRGQGRGNSGCYLQGRYEVQILDSFGLEGKDNECGGIYSVKSPDLNLCYPPLSWQTYDIDYTAARYGADGKKTSPAKIGVRHNGVVIHHDVELPKGTTASPVPEGPEPGPLHLQNHGNPVRFRNIWIVERK